MPSIPLAAFKDADVTQQSWSEPEILHFQQASSAFAALSSWTTV